MEMRITTLLLVIVAGVHGILPDFGFSDDGPAFENGMTASENLPIFDNVNQQEMTRVARSPREGLSIDELTRKLQNKVNTISQERSNGGVPAKSIRELEDLMKHPTWLTDTSNNENEHLMSKDRRTFFVPAPEENSHLKPAIEPPHQMEHIGEVIKRFHELKPQGPITDNRITKFVFTHDVDMATSRTVQQHNREVESAFMEFNKKLEETLNTKNKKTENGKNTEKEILDRSFNTVVSFLDKNIHKLKEQNPHTQNAHKMKEENPHKQVCRKHKSHSKESMQDKDYSENGGGNFKRMGNVAFSDAGASMDHAGMLRFNELVQTRDGLENALLGLDRHRGGPYKRHVSLKFGRGHPVKSQEKKHY